MVVVNNDGSCFIIAALQAILSVTELPDMLTSCPLGAFRDAMTYLIEAKQAGRVAVYVHELRNSLGADVMFRRGGSSLYMFRSLCDRIPALKAEAELLLDDDSRLTRRVGLWLTLTHASRNLQILLEKEVVAYPSRLLFISFRKRDEELVPECLDEFIVRGFDGIEKRLRLVATIQRRPALSPGRRGHAWSRVLVESEWFEIDRFKAAALEGAAVNEQTAAVVYQVSVV
jgi:hypothetical protein